MLFAVGYNRFRGQPDFDPIFSQHLKVLAEKSVYIGLRNSGSIRALKEYIPAELHHKIRFQPCMTTLLSRVYPHLFSVQRRGHGIDTIALNAAFDRPQMRFGESEVATLTRVASAVKAVVGEKRVLVVSHCPDDDHIVPFVRGAGINFSRVNLVNASPTEVMQFYANVDVAVGMRGHAQMIPFGCGTPIISLISHDKLAWFLEDIGRPQWGVDVNAEDFADRLKIAFHDIENNVTGRREEICKLQDDLWNISVSNISDANRAFGLL